MVDVDVAPSCLVESEDAFERTREAEAIRRLRGVLLCEQNKRLHGNEHLQRRLAVEPLVDPKHAGALGIEAVVLAPYPFFFDSLLYHNSKQFQILSSVLDLTVSVAVGELSNGSHAFDVIDPCVRVGAPFGREERSGRHPGPRSHVVCPVDLSNGEVVREANPCRG